MKNAIRLAGLSALLAAFALPGMGQAIEKRADNQQERIAQGEKSGELTRAEATKLEKNEAKINKEVRRDRAENGGTLTPQERAKVKQQQNHESKQIYRAKHNGRVR